MSKISRTYCTTALGLLLSTGAAFADVTNAEVWENWQGYMSGIGYSITANEVIDGTILSVTDIKMTPISDDSAEDVSATLPELTFTEQTDGSVKVAIPALSEIIFDITPEAGEKIDMVIEYAHDGLDMTVTGEDGTFNYAYTANDINISLGSLLVGEEKVSDDITSASINLKDLSSNSTITEGELRSYTQALNAGVLSYIFAFADSDTEATFKIEGTMQDLTSTSNGTLASTGTDMQDLNAMLNAGLAGAGTFNYAAGAMGIAFDSFDGAGTVNTTSTGGAMTFSVDPEGIKYDVSQTNLALAGLVPDLPLPISMDMALAELNFTMPIQKSDEEQDFALGLTMGDFEVSDLLWGIFDPTAQLPRDPATIALDLSGKAKVLFDFLAPDQAAALESSDTAPGELNALTLKNLVVDAVGARLTGTGDFTFDNSDVVTFDGMPRPTGAVDLELVGGNGLLDRLVAMGILPEQQAIGARLMMGLFAVVGAEPDTLTSKIEINDAGHVLANGQRIQ